MSNGSCRSRYPNNNKTMLLVRFFAVWICILGLSANGLAQGSRSIRLRVRKTGEFGRRIPALSPIYQPPSRSSRANNELLDAQGSENIRSDNVFGLRKPSLMLELPLPSPVDQQAEETGETLQGYAYPAPKSGNNPYENNNDKQPAVPEYENNQVPQEEQPQDAPPEGVVPEREAIPEESDNGYNGINSESEELINAESLSPSAQPEKLSESYPEADHSDNKCSDSDPNCWPHGYGGEIPGEAGTDYPILSEIINTPFDCNDVPYSGYYADPDDQARCQIFHVCLKGNQYRKTQKWSFLCPNGTLFSQNDFVCVWWSSVECNAQTVQELSLRNAELGWDNLTEAGGSNPGPASNNFNMASGMESLINSASSQPSSSNSRIKNTLPQSPARRPQNGNGNRNANTYRVPVKVDTDSGARTKLKEVSGNSLQTSESSGNNNNYNGVEHNGEESEAYETSLRHQSESRTKSKTASALLKSESEAYEQKSVPDSVSPFITNRQPIEPDLNSANPEASTFRPGDYPGDDGLSGTVVMMPTQQRYPDGSEGYAEVPVLVMNGGGYTYPTTTTSTPGPTYLPPQNEYSPPSTTTEVPSTTVDTTEVSYDSQAGYDYQTTQEPAAFSAQIVREATTGYSYPSPGSVTEESTYSNIPTVTDSTDQSAGYNYQNPTESSSIGYPTTTEQSEGYNYQNPSTTQDSVYNTELASILNEVSTQGQGGYADYTQTTTDQSSVLGSEAPEGTYLPPKAEGGYDSSPPQVSANLQKAADTLSLPNAGADTSDSSNVPTEYSDEAEGVSEAAAGNEVTTGDAVSGGYANEPDTTVPSYHIPSPASLPPPGGENLDAQQEDKINKILEEIQKGGAEVRDENGNKLDYDQLQKIIAEAPEGELALQKADESQNSPVNSESSTSTTTEAIPVAKDEALEPESEEGTNNSQEETTEIISENSSGETKPPPLETVQTIEEFTPSQTPQRQQEPNQFLPNFSPPIRNTFGTFPQNTQSGYHSQQSQSSKVADISYPGFEIKTPGKEYESHSVEQNSIEVGTKQGESFSTGYNNFAQPQGPPQATQFPQTFLPTQQSLYNQYYSSPNPFSNQVSQQGTNQPSIQSQPNGNNQVVNYPIRPPAPQPEVYYQQNQQNQQIQQVFPSQGFTSQPNQQQVLNQQSISQPNPDAFYSPQQTQQQQPYFESRQPSIEYLPPQHPTGNQQSQLYSTNQPRPVSSSLIPGQRDNIQLQQSFSIPFPQASTNNRQQVRPDDVKIVPALFVHQHTRVENPDGSPIDSGLPPTQKLQSQFANQNFQQEQNPRVPNIDNRDPALTQLNNIQQPKQTFNGKFSSQIINNVRNNGYLPYSSQTEVRPVSIRAPRLNPFQTSDALPKLEQFTAEDGRTAEQFRRSFDSQPSQSIATTTINRDFRKFQRPKPPVVVVEDLASQASHPGTFITPPSSMLTVPPRRQFVRQVSSSSRDLWADADLLTGPSSMHNFYSDPARDSSFGRRLIRLRS